MYSAESFQKVLVPKYYKSRSALIEDAFRALLNLKPGLKVEIGVELYQRGEVSLSKAAEIAGVNVVQFKEILTHKGVTRGVGSGVEELMRKTEELKIATR